MARGIGRDRRFGKGRTFCVWTLSVLLVGHEFSRRLHFIALSLSSHQASDTELRCSNCEDQKLKWYNNVFASELTTHLLTRQACATLCATLILGSRLEATFLLFAMPRAPHHDIHVVCAACRAPCWHQPLPSASFFPPRISPSETN